MSKRLHIVCNAHLDPVWQWEWEEGAAEALSTFKIAADFCDEYDSFVFCHNEALLYKWIEEYDPQLFARIQKLVNEGKWHIMGGWHLQPDCNMPSGEAFVRQILSGRKYFEEKFGVKPTVAVNVDPFGHSRGLVQIMKKCGYEGYLFMRPSSEWITLPNNEFRWIGYDGSEITAIRMKNGYGSGKGKAAQKIKNCIEDCEDGDFYLCLWGIGNHGGGPSRKDLDDIEALTAEMKENDVKIIQSTPEKYLDEVKKKRSLPSFDKSLNPWAVGCYTSQVRIKQRYRRAENEFIMTESMCTQAELEGLIDYPQAELESALYDILTVQFHDMLPGSSIQPAEEMGLRMLDHSLEILSRLKARAFFALTASQKKPPEDKIPIFAYNPHPYTVKGDFTGEFMLWDQNWTDEFVAPTVYAENGEVIPSQCEKEYSSIPLQWRKRIVFNAELKPMSITRFECAFHADKKPVSCCTNDKDYYIFNSKKYSLKINRKTGLVDYYSDKTNNFVCENAFELQIFEDNYDPWYMEAFGWFKKIDSFKLLSNEEATEFCSLKKNIEAVHVIESGEVRTVIEAVFGYKSSRALVKYFMSEESGLKIDIRIVWNEKQKLVKLNIPTTLKNSVCIGEQAYGREILRDGFNENVSQKYVAVCDDNNAFLAINSGIYGSSFDNGELKITLLRSPSYCAHPIGGRETMPQDKYLPHIEQGERDFSFIFDIGKKDSILDSAPRKAQEFSMQPMLLSLYPAEKGELHTAPVTIEDNNIITLTAFKKAENGNGYVLRLFNPVDRPQTAKINVADAYTELCFGRFEIKTIKYENGKLTESADLTV